MVHVCLCGTQPQTWDVKASAARQGLELVEEVGTGGPVHTWLFPPSDVSSSDADQAAEADDTDAKDDEVNDGDADGRPPSRGEVKPLPVESGYPAPRRYRNGRLGSRHFLGRYGYRHRRTTGDGYGGDDSDMAVEGSVNFVFRRRKKADAESADAAPTEHSGGGHCCPVCGIHFTEAEELKEHLADPGAMLQPKAIAATAKDDEGKQDPFVDEATGRAFDSAYALSTFLAQREARRQRQERKRPRGADGDDNAKDSASAATAAAAGTVSDQGEPDDEDDIASAKKGVSNQEIIPAPEATAASNGEPAKQYPPYSSRTVFAERQVPTEHEGRRLRWYCRRPEAFASLVGSRKTCENMIKAGRVYVNATAATDSSRVLMAVDVVSVMAPLAVDAGVGGASGNGGANCASAAADAVAAAVKSGARIVRVLPRSDLLVVYKPVGMRSAGTFSESTLESVVPRLLLATSTSSDGGGGSSRCEVLTKLETGCSGLCAVRLDGAAPTSSSPSVNDSSSSAAAASIEVTYSFTALVHGRVPDAWTSKEGARLELPAEGARRWKSHKRKNNDADEAREEGGGLNEGIDDAEGSSGVAEAKGASDAAKVETTAEKPVKSVSIRCTHRTPPACPAALSTVVVTSSADSGRLCNVLCYALRKAGYPVVNDRFCRSEYASLPRSMRNVVKSKLCVGCYGLSVTTATGEANAGGEAQEEVTIDAPDRLSAKHWGELLPVRSE